jgi:hypothetical protein
MKAKVFIYLFLIAATTACVKEYTPKAILAANKYLVVDGFINATPNSITSFSLKYSRNLSDSTAANNITGAQVSIQGKSGIVYNLTDNNSTGTYSSALQTINKADQYQIKIKLNNGAEYASEFVPVKTTPAIDSITWEQPKDLTFFVNTQDLSNNTLYYKWDFTETWEHHAPVQNYWGVDNGLIFFMDSTNQRFKCWTTALSGNIITGTSVALSADVIKHKPVYKIIKDDERLTVRYSMLLNQYAITPEAYNYWLLIEKNSQQLGSLFDVQPSQLKGNISNTSNTDEPVIGFITACTLSQKRIFVNNADLNGWATILPYNDCGVLIIPTNPTNSFIYDYPDPDYAPFYFVGSGPPDLVISKKYCIDCRTQGGINTKPSFW